MSEKDQINNEEKEQDKFLFSWRGPDFIKHEKTMKWYFFASIAVLLLIIWALLENSAAMAIAILISAGVYFLYESQHPQEVQIMITEVGVRIGDIFYPYSELKSFYIEYNSNVKRLHFTKNGRTAIKIDINLPDDLDIAGLREYLLTELVEEEESEQNFLDKFFKFIKF